MEMFILDLDSRIYTFNSNSEFVSHAIRSDYIYYPNRFYFNATEFLTYTATALTLLLYINYSTDWHPVVINKKYNIYLNVDIADKYTFPHGCTNLVMMIVLIKNNNSLLIGNVDKLYSNSDNTMFKGKEVGNLS